MMYDIPQLKFTLLNPVKYFALQTLCLTLHNILIKNNAIRWFILFPELWTIQLQTKKNYEIFLWLKNN